MVATKLNQPTGLVVLPDGTALVGERTTGRILRVQPMPGQPATLVQRLAGVDGSGDGGLLDLAISPTFDQDGLIYAYLSTATDNRVVHFSLGSPPSAIVTGIPKGRTGNAGRIAFDATGALLTGTGDAGRPALAASATSLAGKILRTSDIGRPLPDNPVPGSPIFARGLRSVDGLCVDPRTGLRIAISAAAPPGPGPAARRGERDQGRRRLRLAWQRARLGAAGQHAAGGQHRRRRLRAGGEPAVRGHLDRPVAGDRRGEPGRRRRAPSAAACRTSTAGWPGWSPARTARSG